MNPKMKVGNFDTACLLLNMISSKIILSFPRTVAEDAGTAGWLLTLLVSIAAVVLFTVLSGLYKSFAGRDILDIGESATGSVGKMMTGIIFILQFLVSIPIVLREFSEDMKVISLPSTPISIVMLFFSAGMVVGAWLGLETLTRIHALTVPILAGAFVLILLLNVQNYDISRLAPWLGLGSELIIQRGIKNLSIFSELIVLFFMLPYLNRKQDFVAIGRYSLVITGVFLVLASLCYTLTYQYPATTEMFLPMYQMTREINLGRFFTRIESAFIVIWASSAFLYLSSGLYFVTWLFKVAFGLKYHKPLLFPFGILIYTLSIVPENLYSTLQIEMVVYRSWSWMLTFLLPLLLLIFAKIRVRRKNGKEAMK
jgi:spore germination protein (amino acid permease)